MLQTKHDPEYVERRRSLQECGTQWAHENVQSVGETETGRFKQELHRIANELVEEAVENDCSYIAFEDLTDIRADTERSEIPRVGVPTPVRDRRVQSRSKRYLG